LQLADEIPEPRSHAATSVNVIVSGFGQKKHLNTRHGVQISLAKLLRCAVLS